MKSRQSRYRRPGTLLSSFRTFCAGLFRKPLSAGRWRRNPRRLRQRNSASESLERRTLLASVIWDGNTDGDGDGVHWNDPMNWSGDQLPDSTDEAVIGAAFSTDTIIHGSGNTTINRLEASSRIDVTGGSFRILGDSELHGLLQVVNDGHVILESMELNGSGTLANHVTAQKDGVDLLDATVRVTVDNDGHLEVPPRSSSTIMGDLISGRFSVIHIAARRGVDSGRLTVTNGFQNDGRIELLHQFDFSGPHYAASLKVETGTLVNSKDATIWSDQGSLNFIDAELENQGSIDVNRGKLTLRNESRTFDTDAGDIDVDASSDFLISGGTTVFGTSTSLIGDGTINLLGDTSGAGPHDLRLAGTFTFDSAAPELRFGGIVTVSGGTFVNRNSLLLDDDDFADSTTLNNEALLATRPGTVNRIDGPLDNDSNGTIRIESQRGTGASVLTIGQAFQNHGRIELTHLSSNTGPNGQSRLNVPEGLNIASGGSLVSSGPGQLLNAPVVNAGEFSVTDGVLQVLNTNRIFRALDGTLDVGGPATLRVSGGETQLGSGLTLSGLGVFDLAGDHTLALPSDVTFEAADPQLEFGGEVVVHGPGRLSIARTLRLDSDTINADLVNNGSLLIQADSVESVVATIHGQLETTQGSLIRIVAKQSQGDGTLNVSQDFVNHGRIELEELANPTGGPHFTARLFVNETVTLDQGGELAGNGEIHGNVVNLAGIVTPGLSTGELVVVGDYDQRADGRYLVEFAGDAGTGQFDHLQVTGNALLDGMLTLTLDDYTPPLNEAYIILDANSVSGEFAATNAAAVDASVSYDVDSVAVQFDNPNAAPFLKEPFKDLVFDEDGGGGVNLPHFFDDPDLPDDTLTFSVASNSNSDLITTSITGGILDLSLTPDAHGVATIRVRATDEAGESAEGEFDVTVNPVNDDPVATKNLNVVSEDTILPVEGNLISDDDGFGIDSDVDSDPLSVVEVNGATVPGPMTGQYGTFSWNQKGEYRYQQDITIPAVQSLSAGERLMETFVYTLSDGNGGTDTATLTITIVGENDDAVFRGDDHGETQEDQTLAASGTLTVIDVDNGEGSIIPDHLSGDFGSFTIDADGKWNYSLDNTSANVQALRAGQEVHDLFEVSSDDGTKHIVDVLVVGTNDAAVIGGDVSGFVEEDGKLIAEGTLTVTDVDENEDSFNPAIRNGTRGDLTLKAGGNWRYELNNSADIVQSLAAGQTVSDHFTITSRDGTPRNLRITIFGENDAPMATDNSGAVNEDDSDPISGNLLTDDDGHGVDTDPDDDPLTVSDVNLSVDPADDVAGDFGTLRWQPDGTWDYTINNSLPQVQSLAVGETLTDTFVYTLADPHGGTDQAQLAITITGENDGPTATHNRRTIGENTTDPIAGNLLTDDDGFGVDSDPDMSDTLSVLEVFEIPGVTQSYGSISHNADGTYQWTLDNDHPDVQALTTGDTLIDRWMYSISDGSGGTATAVLTIEILGVDDVPVAAPNLKHIDEDDSQPLAGNVITDDDGFGVDRDPENDSLVVVDVAGNTDPDLPVAGHWGTLDWSANGTFMYSLDNTNSEVQGLAAGDTLDEVFEYQISDPGGQSDTASLTIRIHGVNDVATITGDDIASVQEDVVLSGSGRLVVTDIDQNEDRMVPDTQSGTYGTLEIAADGYWTYTLHNDADIVQALTGGQLVHDAFTVNSVDGTPHVIDVAVIGTNDVAEIDGDDSGHVQEDVTLTAEGTLSVTDRDAGEAAFTPFTSDRTFGTFQIAESGEWQFELLNGSMFVQSLRGGETVEESFDVTSVDGTPHVIHVVVTGTNDAAIFGGDDSGNVTEDGTLLANGSVTVSDVDRDEGTIVPGTLQGAYGSITLADTGLWEYQLDNASPRVQRLAKGEIVEDAFSIRSDDDTPHIVRIQVRGSNDNPVASDNVRIIDEDTTGPVSGNLLTDDDGVGVDTDVDAADVLQVTQINTSTHPALPVIGTYGMLVWHADGRYSYLPEASHPEVQRLTDGQSLFDFFEYVISDSHDGTDTAELTIEISGMNDAPTATENTAVTADDAVLPVSGNLISDDDGFGIDTDPERQPLTVSDVNGQADATQPIAGQFGTLTWSENGDWHYSVDETHPDVVGLPVGDTLIETFEYHNTDGQLQSDAAVLTITIYGTDAHGAIVNDDWHFVTDADGSGTVSFGDIVSNANDPNSTAEVAGVYGVDAFGRISSGSETGELSEFDSINDAIAAVELGSSVTLLPGEYEQNVRMDRDLILEGLTGEANDVVIRPESGHGIHITGEFDQISVEGLRVTRGDNGIHIHQAAGEVLLSNVFAVNNDSAGISTLDFDGHLETHQLVVALNDVGLHLQDAASFSDTNSSFRNNEESGIRILRAAGDVILTGTELYRNRTTGLAVTLTSGFANGIDGDLTMQRITVQDGFNRQPRGISILNGVGGDVTIEGRIQSIPNPVVGEPPITIVQHSQINARDFGIHVLAHVAGDVTLRALDVSANFGITVQNLSGSVSSVGGDVSISDTRVHGSPLGITLQNVDGDVELTRVNSINARIEEVGGSVNVSTAMFRESTDDALPGVWLSTVTGNVTLSDVASDHHAGTGVKIDAVGGYVSVTNVGASENGAHGVWLQGGISDHVTLDGVTAQRNSGSGLRIDGSIGSSLAIRDAFLFRNTRSGLLRLGATVGDIIIEDVVARLNDDDGIHIQGSQSGGLLIRDSDFDINGNTGLSLGGTVDADVQLEGLTALSSGWFGIGLQSLIDGDLTIIDVTAYGHEQSAIAVVGHVVGTTLIQDVWARSKHSHAIGLHASFEGDVSLWNIDVDSHFESGFTFTGTTSDRLAMWNVESSSGRIEISGAVGGDVQITHIFADQLSDQRFRLMFTGAIAGQVVVEHVNVTGVLWAENVDPIIEFTGETAGDVTLSDLYLSDSLATGVHINGIVGGTFTIQQSTFAHLQTGVLVSSDIASDIAFLDVAMWYMQDHDGIKFAPHIAVSGDLNLESVDLSGANLHLSAVAGNVLIDSSFFGYETLLYLHGTIDGNVTVSGDSHVHSRVTVADDVRVGGNFIVNATHPYDLLLDFEGQHLIVEGDFEFAPTVGELNLQDGSTLATLGTFVLGDGVTLVVDTTSELSAETICIQPGGVVSGNGTLTGNVENKGTMSPGASPGKLTVDGNLFQAATGSLLLETDGPTPVSEHDVLQVNGDAVFEGSLDVVFGNGVSPQPGDTFEVLSVNGTLDTDAAEVTIIGLPDGHEVQLFGGSLVAPPDSGEVLVTDPNHPGQRMLIVGGTPDDDRIQVQFRRGRRQIQTRVNGQRMDRHRVENLSRFVVLAGDGDDQILLSPQLELPTELYGGAGNDRIQGGRGADTIHTGSGRNFVVSRDGDDRVVGGPDDDTLWLGAGLDLAIAAGGGDVVSAGSGNDVVSGGEGNDRLFGGSGRDILIGGSDPDRLYGGRNEDLLIAGTTVYDDNASALMALIDEWSSGRRYEQRMDNLRNGTGPVLEAATAQLAAGVTVHDDNARDRLFGGAGRDWFFAGRSAGRGDRLFDDRRDEEIDWL